MLFTLIAAASITSCSKPVTFEELKAADSALMDEVIAICSGYERDEISAVTCENFEILKVSQQLKELQDAAGSDDAIYDFTETMVLPVGNDGRTPLYNKYIATYKLKMTEVNDFKNADFEIISLDLRDVGTLTISRNETRKFAPRPFGRPIDPKYIATARENVKSMIGKVIKLNLSSVNVSPLYNQTPVKL
jgi:hypothetical protein